MICQCIDDLSEKQNWKLPGGCHPEDTDIEAINYLELCRATYDSIRAEMLEEWNTAKELQEAENRAKTREAKEEAEADSDDDLREDMRPIKREPEDSQTKSQPVHLKSADEVAANAIFYPQAYQDCRSNKVQGYEYSAYNCDLWLDSGQSTRTGVRVHEWDNMASDAANHNVNCLQAIALHEPRSFFLPFGFYRKDTDRQLYVSSDERDPLVTTAWFLFGQPVREQEIELLLTTDCKPPDHDPDDPHLRDFLGNRVDPDAMDADAVSRPPEPAAPPTPEELKTVDSSRIVNDLGPTWKEKKRPYLWMGENHFPIDNDDISGSVAENEDGQHNPAWSEWVEQHHHIVPFNWSPEDASLAGDAG